MAIDALSLSRPSALNSTGSPRALLLAKWSGEVLAAFIKKTSGVNDIILRMPIEGAGTVKFPAFGRISSGFHVAGNNIFTDGEAGRFNHVQREIQLDDLLTASTAVDNIERLITGYEFRSEYMTAMGNELAVQYDTFALIQAFRAARTNITNSPNLIPTDMGANGGGGFVGSLDLTTGTTTTEGQVLLEALFTAKQTLDEKEVPSEDRYFFTSFANYNRLVLNRELIDVDRLGNNNQNGIFWNGTVAIGAGFRLVATNRLPTTNIVANPLGANNTYTGNFTATVGIAFHKSAIGAIWLKPPGLEMEYDMQYKAWLLSADMCQGVGRRRYESAVELSTAASQPALT